MVFLTICSVQNVQNDRTDIFGLKISRNMPYGIDSYLSIMIFARIFRRKTRFSTRNSHRNHNTQVRIDSIWRISVNFQTENVRTVILHILDRTDCQQDHLKNKSKGKIPVHIF